MANAASRIFNVMKKSGTDTVSELVHLKVKTINPLTLILDDRVILTEDFFELSKSINIANIHVDDILVGISLNGGQKYLIQENSNDEAGVLPPGGFAGEVLSKESNDDFDVKWKNMSELSKVGDTLPIGSVIEFPSDNIPDNWLLCNGQAVSRTEYSELFKAIGTTWGAGDGSTTFNVPTKDGLVTVGKKSSDEDFNTLGKTGGEKEHTLTISELPSHIHTGMTYNDTNFGIIRGSGETQGHGVAMTSDTTIYAPSNLKTKASGDGQAHNNLQPYITSNFIIKAKQSVGLVANVVDNLNSDSSTNALSAKQGRILNDKINELPITVYGTGDEKGIIDPNITLESLILTQHPNNPDNGTEFYYIMTYFYSEKSVESNRCQMAYGYRRNKVWFRYFYNDTWSAWERVDRETERTMFSSTNGTSVTTQGWQDMLTTAISANLSAGKYFCVLSFAIGGYGNGMATVRPITDGNESTNAHRCSIPVGNNLLSSGQVSFYISVTAGIHTIQPQIYSNVNVNIASVFIEFYKIGDV